MLKTTLIISGLTGLAFLTVTTMTLVQSPGEDIEVPGQISMPSIQLNANNSSATASTSFVVVQDTITDVEYDATPVKKPGTTQG